MAISMDGHTINQLSLVGADGVEVKKSLVQTFPNGTKAINTNGDNIDVRENDYVSVNVQGASDSIEFDFTLSEDFTATTSTTIIDTPITSDLIDAFFQKALGENGSLVTDTQRFMVDISTDVGTGSMIREHYMFGLKHYNTSIGVGSNMNAQGSTSILCVKPDGTVFTQNNPYALTVGISVTTSSQYTINIYGRCNANFTLASAGTYHVTISHLGAM